MLSMIHCVCAGCLSPASSVYTDTRYYTGGHVSEYRVDRLLPICTELILIELYHRFRVTADRMIRLRAARIYN